MKDKVKSRESKFLMVVCPVCGHQQTIFGKATTKVKCINCGYMLVQPTGGKARVKAKIVKIL